MTYPVISICAAIVTAFLAATWTASLIARWGFPLPETSRRIGCIDGLRGYVALCVLAHHFIIWLQIDRLHGTWAEPTVNFFEQLGAGGVSLFFMVTGLLFYPRISAGFRAGRWGEIYLSRAFRILPLVAFSVCVITLLIMLRTGRTPDGDYWAPAIKWIFAQSEPDLLGYQDSGRLNAYVLWSLKYEWQFYLIILPFSALAVDLVRGRLPNWVLPTAILFFALAMQMTKILPSIGIWRYLPLFAIGMLAFEIERRPRLLQRLRSRSAAVAALVALAIGLTVFHSPYSYALPFFGLFFFAVAAGNSFGGILSSPAALVLGECSYGLYLLHGLLLSLFFVDGVDFVRPIATPWLPSMLPLIAVLAVLVTAGTYLLIERPFIRLGRATLSKARTLIRSRAIVAAASDAAPSS